MVAAAKLAVVAGAWLLVPAKCCKFVVAGARWFKRRWRRFVCLVRSAAVTAEMEQVQWCGEDGCCGGRHGCARGRRTRWWLARLQVQW